MARGCSPKGVVKKHNLYNKQPKDWGQGRGGEGRGGGGEGRGGREKDMECRVGEIAHMSSHHCPLPSFHPHPDVRLCGDLLSTVQIHHLWRAVSQGRESLYLVLTLPVAHLLWVHLTDVTTAIVTQHKDSCWERMMFSICTAQNAEWGRGE